jgi:hypothetical protein
VDVYTKGRIIKTFGFPMRMLVEGSSSLIVYEARICDLISGRRAIAAENNYR